MGTDIAYECQIEKGKYILPDYSTLIKPPFEEEKFENFMWDGDDWVGVNTLVKEHDNEEKEFNIEDTSVENIVEICSYVFEKLSSYAIGDASGLEIFSKTKEQFMLEIKQISENLPKKKEENHVDEELSIDIKIDNLMNVKQELLRETQDLLSKYKFFSQELDKLWVEYNNSQLKDDI